MKWMTLVSIFLLTSEAILADRGIIIAKDVNLAEPAQRAIIMHNGTWEMLILQTDVQANKSAHAVEFMPLPAKPEVSLAPKECFKNLQLLIDKHQIKYYIVQPRKIGSHDSGQQSEGIKIILKHDLGPHHVTVVEINDVNAFQNWVTHFFADNGLGKPAMTNQLINTVADYFTRGFKYFAFDVIDMVPGRKTIAPLTYHFKCDHVYYPLKVTNLYGGKGTIEVFYAINPWRDPHADGPNPNSFDRYNRQEGIGTNWIFSREVNISTDELGTLHPAAKELFLAAGSPFFATKYEGDLRFTNDVWLNVGYASPEYLCMGFLSLLREGDIQGLEHLTDVPFGLNRKTFNDKLGLFSELSKLVRDPNLITFQIKNRASFSGIWSNEFDKIFIESFLKNQTWHHFVLESDLMSLHFFTVYQNDDTFRVVYFRIGKLNDY
ncbi:MAG: DUF2330 domain-containing protein [Phycisphaerales bacterium]